MNTVLIPCFNRPEFLHYVIEQIKKADRADQYHYIFRPDVGFDKEILTVIKNFPFSYEVTPTGLNRYNQRRRSLSKQSYNVLSGYALAASKSTGLVFMIEEDIMIGKDFFSFHESVHSQHKLFVSLAVRNINRSVETSGEVDEYYLSTGDYCSLGVCFQKEVILQHILPHMTDSYFKDPVGYVTVHFPDSSIGRHFAEQDGLIRRIQMYSGLPTCYPFIPRAYHSGYYGYNRKRGISGTLAQKIDRIGKVIFSPEAMRKEAMHPEFYNDSIPQRLVLPEWSVMREKQIEPCLT